MGFPLLEIGTLIWDHFKNIHWHYKNEVIFHQQFVLVIFHLQNHLGRHPLSRNWDILSFTEKNEVVFKYYYVNLALYNQEDDFVYSFRVWVPYYILPCAAFKSSTFFWNLQHIRFMEHISETGWTFIMHIKGG